MTSAAFDVVNRDLLFKRMDAMGLPDEWMYLFLFSKNYYNEKVLEQYHNDLKGILFGG